MEEGMEKSNVCREGFPVMEFLACEGALSLRLDEWVEAHPGVALAVVVSAPLVAAAVESWS